MKSNIALIGFMGTGKSASGKVLAEKLGMEYIDLDSLVEEKTGKSIAEIFQSHGEQHFRKLESEAVSEVSSKGHAVISCGGGVVLYPSNIKDLKKTAVIVYLHAEPDVVLDRVKENADVRPLLKFTNPSRTIAELMKARRPLYEQAADMVIDTSHLDIDEVASKIIEGLTENESINLQK
jgi:shikimate kinase